MSSHGRPSRERGRTTLGRFGGLSPGEAERGERALWLDGDGFRAALFHLGALTRLNELGLLARVSAVGAVSGGSIAAALLATRVRWPLHGAYRDWPDQVAGPLRELAGRNVRARAFLRRPLPRPGAGAELEERFARELVGSLGGESRWGPRFVFGASGLTLSGLVAGWEECADWEIGGCAQPGGYSRELVEESIAAVRTDLDAFGEAERAVLENHGYLLADAALRNRGLVNIRGIEPLPPEPPHPRWMDERKVREALAGSSRRTRLGRLRASRARRPPRSPQAGSPELTRLLQRHRPLLRYDSMESLRAETVATICSLALPDRCNTLRRADGSLIASVEPLSGEAKLELGFLGASYGNGEPARPGDYLDGCGGLQAADALRMWRGGGGADVVYGRARHDGEGALWLQYWLFFYHEDKGLLGLERREGDWEAFQIRLGGDGEPEAAIFARHAGAEVLDWARLEHAESEDGPVVVVHPARGSHAPLPRPGTYPAPVVPDHNDGRGPLVRPRLEPIADDGPRWVHWPGRWGSTRRREYFEATSPRGPRGNPCWWDPAELHGEAQPWPGGARETLAAVAAPRLEARREGAVAVISYAFPDPESDEREPARLVAAPLDDTGEVGGAHAFAVEPRRASVALHLPDGREWRGVRVCAASVRGVPGPTTDLVFAG